MIRCKRNKVHVIHLPSGEWCKDPDTIKREAISFFKMLFCTKEPLGVNTSPPHPCCLNVEDSRESSKSVSKEEVYRAIMGTKSYKVPGSYGFQSIFFKMFWDDIGNDVWCFVRNSFSPGWFNPQIYETILVHNWKGDNPTSFKEFRPISLCNVIYKIISKILVNRLRPILPGIVSVTF